QVIPDAIDLSAGEEWIVGPSDPVGQGQQAIGVRSERRRVGTKEQGPQYVAVDRMLDLADAVHPHDLLAVELVFVELITAVVLDDAILHTTEKRRQTVIIRLRPAVERVIVTARALHANAKEDLRGSLGAVLRIAQGAIPVGGGMTVGAAASSEQFTGEFIQRFAVGDAATNPIVEHLHALAVENLLLAVQQIRPFERPKIGKLRA